jgi:hypothetical protein
MSIAEEEEEANLAEVMADEAACKKLILLISIRDETPVEKLKVLDLDELEALWNAGPGSGPAQPTTSNRPAKPTTSNKASTNASTKVAGKAPAKTPAKKISSSLPRVSSVSLFLSYHIPESTLTIASRLQNLAHLSTL